jgi:hypothetical protein
MSAMLSCKEVSRIVSESMDRSVTMSESLEMKMHLFMCKFCSRFKRQLFSIRKTMRAHAALMEEVEDSVTLCAEAKERMKRLIEKNAAS